jgi:hypothetical protein
MAGEPHNFNLPSAASRQTTESRYWQIDPRVIFFKKFIWPTMTDHDKLKKELAVATAMFQNLAIVGALAECHLVDPTKIAK